MVYEEVDLDDMDYNEETGMYTYACPCGDVFQISEDELEEGEDIAHCPSCSLVIRVLYDLDDEEEEDDAAKPQAPQEQRDAGEAQPQPPVNTNVKEAAVAAEPETAAAAGPETAAAAEPEPEPEALPPPPPGLRITGLAKRDQAKYGGVFTVDPLVPVAGGRQHWVTAAGGHLYYSVAGRWILRPRYDPAETACVAAFATAAQQLPAGRAAWKYHDGKGWGSRELEVAALTAAEVAERLPGERAAAAAVSAERAAAAEADGVVEEVMAELIAATGEAAAVWLGPGAGGGGPSWPAGSDRRPWRAAGERAAADHVGPGPVASEAE